MKNNKIVYILVSLILLVVVIDGVLIFQTKNEKSDLNNSDEIQEKVYDCSIELNDRRNEEIGIDFDLYGYYHLRLNEHNKLFPDGYYLMQYFNNIEDLEKYYNYLISITQQNSKLPFEKKEEELMISYHYNTMDSEYKIYDMNYLKTLEEQGWACEETEMIEN